MLIDEKDIVLKARIKVRLEAKFDDDRIVMAVNMGVDAIKALEDITKERSKGLREGDA